MHNCRAAINISERQTVFVGMAIHISEWQDKFRNGKQFFSKVAIHISEWQDIFQRGNV